MRTLLACPFCRELFAQGEAARCPRCGIALVRATSLPASCEDRERALVVARETPPELRVLPWSYWRRGRGLLCLLAALGIASFFLPWVQVMKPHAQLLSGADLARRLFWLWGGFAAWLTVLGVTASRRSVARLRGARLITTTLSALTACDVAMLWLRTPLASTSLPLEIQWQAGLLISALISVAASVVAVRLGGKLTDLEPDFALPARASAQPSPGQSASVPSRSGHTLH